MALKQVSVQNNSSGESSCRKMLREVAADDRIIDSFPPPYSEFSTPYTEEDFHVIVRNACLSDGNKTVGLRLSKVIIVGDVSVGKTCLVTRFCHEIFDCNYKATIGVDFEVERFDILKVPFNLQLWDTAGQERFKCIATAYYRGAQVIIVTFDLSNLYSLRNTPHWLHQTLDGNDQHPVIFLVGTKKDLISNFAFQAVESEALRLAKMMKAEYWSVSSKTGENVTSFFFRVAALAFTRAMLRELEFGKQKEIFGDFVRLKSEEPRRSEKKKCFGSCAT